MKHILLFLFVIILLVVGSCFSTFALTEVIDENNTVLNNYTENLDEEHLSDVEICTESHLDFIEVAENEHILFSTHEETAFINDVIYEDEDSTFEITFFLSMLIFIMLLILLHFYRKDGRVRDYQPFE